MRTPRAYVLLSLTILMTASAPAGASYHEEVLDNGLRVILIEHRANPMVASSVIVGAGVVHEPEGMNGASHFLEHLLFNGTQRRTQRELYDEVDRYGAYNNATTREDHTLFSLLIQKEFVEAGLDIQADMLFHSTLPPDKFEKEKGIVLEELARDSTDPGYLARQAFRSFAYSGTPLARPILGSEASISGMEREAVMAYYKARYVPGNMTLLVMGDFGREAMMNIVRRTFGAAPKGKVPPAAAWTWPKAPEKNLLQRTQDAGRTYLHAAFPVGMSPHDAAMPALELLVSAVASGKDAPLSRDLTTGADPRVLSFSLNVVPRVGSASTLEFEATLKADGDTAEVLDLLAGNLRASGAGSVARDRVASVRSAARAEEVLLSDQIHYFGLMRSYFLQAPPPGYLDRRLASLDAVGARDLDQAAIVLRQALGRARVVVSAPGVEEKRVAWKPETSWVQPAVGGPARAAETLECGLEVAFERNDDSPVFAVHLMFRPRSASEPEGKTGIADFLHRLFLRGTVVKSAASLDAAVASLGARVKVHDSAFIPYDDYYTTPEFSYVRLEMPADRWREGLSLLSEMVVHPRLFPDDVEAVRAEMLDLVSRRGESPRNVARALLDATLAPGHPLSGPVLGSAESVRSITRDDLAAFHASYITGKRMILTGTGPVAPEAFLGAVRSEFGDKLEPGGEVPRVSPLDPTRRGSEARDEVGKTQSYLAMGYLFEADPDDRAALSVAAAILSDKLAFRLREEKGLAYSIGASVGPFGNLMKFRVVMGTRPDNVEEALEGLRSGIEAFREEQIDADSVTKAANALRGRMVMRRLTRVNRAYYAGLDLLRGRPPGDDRRRLDAFLAVGVADVRRVVERYLRPDRCAVVVVR